MNPAPASSLTTSLTPPREDSPLPRWVVTTFCVWYFLAALCCFAPQGRIFAGAIAMGGVWVLVLRFQQPLRRIVAAIPGRPVVRFFLIGILFSDVIMENLAISFHGDLHPNLAVNSFLWLGTYLGLIAAWWIASRWFLFNHISVFIVAGITGVLVEQNWMVPRLILTLQWFPALISIPIVFVVYAAAVAPAFLLVQPPSGRKRPGFFGAALTVAFTISCFYACGAIWLAIFRH